MGWVFVSLTRRIAIGALTALMALGEESARQLYERARLLEERNRNLDEAIRIYGLVVEQAKGDRALAGRALLEQGKLHLRLRHDEQARQAFRRVIVDFSDQPTLVREARDRLGINAFSRSTLSVRPVWATPDSDNSGGPSPDGRFLSFTDWSTGDIGIRDMTTGEKRHLTRREGGQSRSSIFSADSKRIAYWRTDWSALNEIRIVDVDGGTPSRMLCQALDAAQIALTDWSRDGKSILAYVEHKNSPAEIVLISTSDGSIRALKQIAEWPGRMSFSPDGRFVLYNGPGSGGSDVHLLAINGARDIALEPHPADDFAAGWSPDGTRILFTSNRTGPLSLWTLAVRDGEAQGEPQLVLADVGNIEPLGITRNGSLYYWLKTGLVDIYTAAIDPERATLLEAPKPLAHRFVASNQFPDWSPDGKYLLYQSNRPGSDSLIVIRSLDTGAERDLRTSAPSEVSLRGGARAATRFWCQACLLESRAYIALIYRVARQHYRLSCRPASSHLHPLGRQMARLCLAGSTATAPFIEWTSPRATFRRFIRRVATAQPTKRPAPANHRSRPTDAACYSRSETVRGLTIC